VVFAGRTFAVLRECEIGFSGLGLRPEVKIISLTDNGSVLYRAGLIARSVSTGLGGHCSCCSYDNFAHQLFFSSDSVLDVLTWLAATLCVQLVSSVGNIFPRKYFAFDHGNLLGCKQEGQVLPLVRSMC